VLLLTSTKSNTTLFTQRQLFELYAVLYLFNLFDVIMYTCSFEGFYIYDLQVFLISFRTPFSYKKGEIIYIAKEVKICRYMYVILGGFFVIYQSNFHLV